MYFFATICLFHNSYHNWIESESCWRGCTSQMNWSNSNYYVVFSIHRGSSLTCEDYWLQVGKYTSLSTVRRITDEVSEKRGLINYDETPGLRLGENVVFTRSRMVELIFHLHVKMIEDTQCWPDSRKSRKRIHLSNEFVSIRGLVLALKEAHMFDYFTSCAGCILRVHAFG